MISEAVTTKFSKSIFSRPCSKFLVTAKVGLAHYDSLCGGGSYVVVWLARSFLALCERKPLNKGDSNLLRQLVASFLPLFFFFSCSFLFKVFFPPSPVKMIILPVLFLEFSYVCVFLGFFLWFVVVVAVAVVVVFGGAGWGGGVCMFAFGEGDYVSLYIRLFVSLSACSFMIKAMGHVLAI